MLLDTSVIHPDAWDDLPHKRTNVNLAALGASAKHSWTGLTETRAAQHATRPTVSRPARVHSLVLGNYRVLGSLGAGCGGVVFEAEHILMRRKWPSKSSRQRWMNAPELITRFLREMRAVARLDHPNIVAAFDAGILCGPPAWRSRPLLSSPWSI